LHSCHCMDLIMLWESCLNVQLLHSNILYPICFITLYHYIWVQALVTFSWLWRPNPKKSLVKTLCSATTPIHKWLFLSKRSCSVVSSSIQCSTTKVLYLYYISPYLVHYSKLYPWIKSTHWLECQSWLLEFRRVRYAKVKDICTYITSLMVSLRRFCMCNLVLLVKYVCSSH